MVNVWIHVSWRVHAVKMQSAVSQSIVLSACVRMAIEVNQLRDAQDQSVQSIVIVKLINNVTAVHVEIHVYSLAHAA